MISALLAPSIAVIPDGPQGRSGTQLSMHACADRWVPALASLGRDDKSCECLETRDAVPGFPPVSRRAAPAGRIDRCGAADRAERHRQGDEAELPAPGAGDCLQ